MLPFLMQVYKNVAEYQFNEYVKSKGKDPYNLTDGEKAELRANMTGDLYPGEYSVSVVINYTGHLRIFS